MADLDLGTLRYKVEANTNGISTAKDAIFQFKGEAEQAANATRRYGEEIARGNTKAKGFSSGVKALDAEFKRMNADMQRQISLYGKLGKAAEVAYDIERGNLSRLSMLQKQTLLNQAKRYDALNVQTRKMGGAFQAAGYQIGDFAVQVASGQSALVAFTQQGSQLLGFFGPGGAVLGAVLAIGGALGGAFLRGALDATDGVDALDQALERLDRTISTTKDGVFELSQEIQKLADRSEVAARVQIMSSMVEAEKAAKQAANAIAEALSELDVGYGLSGIDDYTEAFADINVTSKGYIETARELGEQFGLTGREAVKAGDQILIYTKQLREAPTPENFERLRDALAEFGTTTGAANTELLTVIGNIQEYFNSAATAAEKTQFLEGALKNLDKKNETSEGAIESLGGAIKNVFDIIDDAQGDEFGLAFGKDPFNSKEWNESADKTIEAVERFGSAVKNVMDEVEKATNPDEFGFAGGENPFTWVEESLSDVENSAESFGDTWGETFGKISEGIGASVNELAKLQGAMADGSKEAEQLGQVMQYLALAQGIAAVASQLAGGDVYTAIPRAIAVAAMLASMGVNTGAGTGGSASAASDAQATQGTGTVFGDPTAKSESISNAVEITADATSKLPGLAQAQLEALRQMQAGISGATANILRGNDFSSMSSETGLIGVLGGVFGSEFERSFRFNDPITGFLDEMLGGALGGSSATINSGIRIMGGTISDLMNNVMVEAFQDVEEKKHFLDDKDVTRFSEALGDEVGQQFALVFGSMVDAVTAAADVLGEDASSAIANFRIAATEISLMDLSGEEQQAALESVFSTIFDNLASAVVPYVDEFAIVGEGMAETLVRVATQVQVADELMGQLGNTLLDGLGGRELAQMSDDLVQAAGGLENFMSVIGNFVNTFATDEHKLTVATNAINSAFDQMGLTVPETRDGVWALMQTLTDPGQIARLAGLTDALDTYYDAIDKQAQAAEAAAQANIAAAQANIAAAESELQLAQTRLSTAMAETDSALNRLRMSVNAEQEALNASFDAQIAAAESAFDRSSDHIQRIIGRTQESVQGLRSLASALSSAVSGNLIQTAAAQGARRMSAQAMIEQALSSSGPIGNIAALTGAAGVLGQGANARNFASQAAFEADQKLTANRLEELAARAGNQASAAERTVMRLESMASADQANHEQLIAQLQADREAQLLTLENIFTDAQESVNLLRGIDNSFGSIDEELNRLNQNMATEDAAREQVEQQRMMVQELKELRSEMAAMRENQRAYSETQERLLRDQNDNGENAVGLLSQIQSNTA